MSALTQPASSFGGLTQDVPGIPFGRLLRVEGRKLHDTRAPKVLLIITVVTSVLLAVAIPWIARASQRDSSSLQWGTAVTLVELLGGTLVPIVGLMLVTSEWSQRSALTTFLIEPRRERVLAAKMLVALGLALAYAVMTSALTALALLFAEHSLHVVTLWPSVGTVLRVLLSGLVQMAFAVAMGMLLMNPAAAIVTVLFLPQLFTLLALIPVHAVTTLIDWLALAMADSRLATGDFSDHGVLKTLVAVLVWVALPLALGTRRQLRAEPK